MFLYKGPSYHLISPHEMIVLTRRFNSLPTSPQSLTFFTMADTNAAQADTHTAQAKKERRLSIRIKREILDRVRSYNKDQWIHFIIGQNHFIESLDGDLLIPEIHPTNIDKERHIVCDAFCYDVRSGIINRLTDRKPMTSFLRIPAIPKALIPSYWEHIEFFVPPEKETEEQEDSSWIGFVREYLLGAADGAVDDGADDGATDVQSRTEDGFVLVNKSEGEGGEDYDYGVTEAASRAAEYAALLYEKAYLTQGAEAVGSFCKEHKVAERTATAGKVVVSTLGHCLESAGSYLVSLSEEETGAIDQVKKEQ